MVREVQTTIASRMRRPRAPLTEVERDVTILVKTFERPDALARLVASIRQFYPHIDVLVIDDSASPIEPMPEGVTRYFHLPYESAGLAGGRNFGLRHVRTDYVLICDDDVVFRRKTDLRRMLRTLQTTSFDIVAARWMDHDPWTGVKLGHRRTEGAVDLIQGNLVRRLGVSRGRIDGLPVFDVVPNFFMAATERLGQDPWDAQLNFLEHVEFFIKQKERGLLSTSLSDVVFYHHPELPPDYHRIRSNRGPYLEVWARKRGFEEKIFVGRWFTRWDQLVHFYPSRIRYLARAAAAFARSAAHLSSL